mmetsp:Transcript_3701/g.7766  ORF Transcript_3701/g.7766 Transcript_3701/m.7766 type:complete len:281 (-) Transcript_3701:42-884(-)
MRVPLLLIGLISSNSLASGFVSGGISRNVMKLRGGYDATVGADPTTPIQFFLLPNNTCPYAQRTHMTLKELGLPFDMTEVSGMPKPDWYLKINPRGKVPSLRVPSVDCAVIYESSICDEFLCDYATKMQVHHNLLPEDPFMRASIRLLNDHCDSVFTKTQFTFLMNKDDTKEDELCAEMENALGAYEDALVESNGPYLFGQDFTLADVHIFPFLQRLVITLKHWKNYELTHNKFPNLLLWLETCSARESAKESSMSKEKTIEVYTRFVGADYKFGGLNKN